jgi:hypothetical protein
MAKKKKTARKKTQKKGRKKLSPGLKRKKPPKPKGVLG